MFLSNIRLFSFTIAFSVLIFATQAALATNKNVSVLPKVTTSESHQDSAENEIRLGANMDFLSASRDFGPSNSKRVLELREVELSLEAQISPRLHGMIFLTRPPGESFNVEEAAVFLSLPYQIKLKAGKYRNEFGLLNTIHEPEQPQTSLPLPVLEFVGEEQLREPSITLGRVFKIRKGYNAGISLALFSGQNDVAFNREQSADKVYSGKLYYGYKSSAYAYQFGFSALTGKNDVEGRLSTNLQAVDFRFLLQPDFAPRFDYSARFMLIGEALFNQRELSSNYTNKAAGYWALADYQFLPAHHIGAGLEYAQGLLDKTNTSRVYSVHYSWYYSTHSRVQLQARRLTSNIVNRGFEFRVQWNIVLGPHSEMPFLKILKSD